MARNFALKLTLRTIAPSHWALNYDDLRYVEDCTHDWVLLCYLWHSEWRALWRAFKRARHKAV